MTEYLLSVHHDDTNALPQGVDVEQVFADVDAMNTELQSTGKYVFAGGLLPASSATVVDAAARTTTDGPYLETKEYLGGFWVIQTDGLDEALEWARRCSAACRQQVEVRPFQSE